MRPDCLERERLSVLAAFSVGGKHKASARRLEVEVFSRIGRVLQKDFHAGIFPAASVILLNGGAVTIDRFFDGEFYGDGAGRPGKFGCDHWVDDSLVGRPFHVRF